MTDELSVITVTIPKSEYEQWRAVCKVMSKSAWDCERIVATAMRILNAVDPDELNRAMEALDDEGDEG